MNTNVGEITGPTADQSTKLNNAGKRTRTRNKSKLTSVSILQHVDGNKCSIAMYINHYNINDPGLYINQASKSNNLQLMKPIPIGSNDKTIHSSKLKYKSSKEILSDSDEN